ncbi:hypothetical protein LMG28138_05656 [Pararobbsia alpina]|uniref:Uncharacterized protein n=1 Tax=Pararobbsia alpina TaxID=621374 RepID=A0A6S7DGG6_9BURK|nr:hypothetical protein LMG28138_05656 [Pararobbsia alpina]
MKGLWEVDRMDGEGLWEPVLTYVSRSQIWQF